MTHRLPQHIVNDLNNAMSSARLQNASFDTGDIKGTVVTVIRPKHTSHHAGSVTDFIRQKVQLHHDTWIVGPLERVLAWSETTDDGSIEEWDVLGRLRAPFPNPAVLEEAFQEIVRLRQQIAELGDFKRRARGLFE